MIDRTAFFNSVRGSLFGGSLSAGQLQGINAILDGWEASTHTDKRWLAYILATAYHETGPVGAKGHMLPVTERGAKDYFAKYDPGTKIGKQLGNVIAGDGYRFRGRGLVQLTGRTNYMRAGKELGVDLIKEPDLALDPAIAVKILIRGMVAGWFTGKRLSDYFNADTTDWKNARRIVNGTDKAAAIAGYATDFYAAMVLEAPVILPTTPPQPMPDDPGAQTPAARPRAAGRWWRVALILAVTAALLGIGWWMIR